jgi:hypothetical protein
MKTHKIKNSLNSSAFQIRRPSTLQTTNSMLLPKVDLDSNVGIEEFSKYVENVRLKNDGQKYKTAFNSYTNSLINAIKLLDIPESSFNTIRSITKLNIYRIHLHDKIGVRKHEPAIHQMLGVFDMYVEFIMWCNNSASTTHAVAA